MEGCSYCISISCKGENVSSSKLLVCVKLEGYSRLYFEQSIPLVKGYLFMSDCSFELVLIFFFVCLFVFSELRAPRGLY